ncbi:hypothetical protein EI28_06610 [Methanoculleus sp. MH98A]|nr:hypothetical protein EI28_02405 [Methanoculleus sp. MH98A]KDE55565.1 hypothetical protein EI28_06610 [Methanoculleus sp. MH98A]
MPSREAQKYLYDIAGAADYIAQFTAGRSFEEYRTDPMLRSAVERQFEIIVCQQALEVIFPKERTILHPLFIKYISFNGKFR